MIVTRARVLRARYGLCGPETLEGSTRMLLHGGKAGLVPECSELTCETLWLWLWLLWLMRFKLGLDNTGSQRLAAGLLHESFGFLVICGVT